MDFTSKFNDWMLELTALKAAKNVATECCSIYRWKSGAMELVHREFVVPHSNPDVFVFSPASLYENCTSHLFKGRAAYGEFMALAAYGQSDRALIAASDIVETDDDTIVWKNGWQSRITATMNDFTSAADFAAVVQQAFESSILALTRRAARLTGCKNLAVSGGVFLNISANSYIVRSGVFDRVYVPSAPHDAGIAIGCAAYGQHILQAKNECSLDPPAPISDRLGPQYTDQTIASALAKVADFVEIEPAQPVRVASILHSKGLVARFSGRSEFGPRALGARSILASPMHQESKERLNSIKGRQEWRPVAPIVKADQFSEFFEGPFPSPYMNYVHQVRHDVAPRFPALFHPDGSTRVQTLMLDDDPTLFQVLEALELLSGACIVVNTSMNGPEEPIIESPSEAVRFFLEHPAIDYLWLGDSLLRARADAIDRLMERKMFLADAVSITVLAENGIGSTTLRVGSIMRKIPTALVPIIRRLHDFPTGNAALAAGGGEITEYRIQIWHLFLTGAIEIA